MWLATLRLESEYLIIRETAGARGATGYAAVVLLGFPLKIAAALAGAAAARVRHRRWVFREYLAIAFLSVPWAVRRLLTPSTRTTWKAPRTAR